MIRSDSIDYVVLNDVINVGDYSGRVTSLGILGLIVRQKLPDASEGEVLDSIKRLYNTGSVALEKYDGNVQAYKPYARYDDAVFFYAGQFRMRITPEGRRAFDLLRAQIPTPPRQAKRVGF